MDVGGATSCPHCLDDSDENLLLDDENVRIRKCSKCKQENNLWTNGIIIKSSNGRIHVSDDHIDVPEDSPLLINDLYGRDSLNEFHCHDSIIFQEDPKAWKKLVTTTILCFLFMVAELIGGYIAGSLAIMTDAAHLFSDFVGFLISLLSIWVGKKPATRRMTFGYHRAEVLGALLSVITIWLLAILFSILALNRLWKKEYEIDADTMLIIASLGLIVNIAMGTILHGVCHSHSHNLGHNESNDTNINVRAASAHVLGDILQSVGVMVAAIIIRLYPEAKLADPICTLLFTIIVIWTTSKVGRDSLWFLLEGSPINSTELFNELHNIPSVRHVHSLHVWSLAPGRDAVTAHLAVGAFKFRTMKKQDEITVFSVVDRFCDRDLVLKKATSIVRKRISVNNCTIQTELYNADLVSSCKHCQS